MATTPQNNIYYRTTTDAFSDATESATQASSIENAFNLREGFNFQWPTATDRTSQTSMIQGSTGYQLDTKTAYIYDNGTWRLSVEHSEWTATSGSIGNGVTATVGTFSIDSSKTTSPNFTASGVSGQIVIANPGLYAISAYMFQSGTHMTVSSYGFIATNNANPFGTALARVPFSDDSCAVVFPNYNVTAAASPIYVYIGNVSGATINAFPVRVRVTRIG